MSRTPRTFALILAATLAAGLFTGAATAGNLNRQRVAADAQWLAHLNLDALTHSKIFAAAMEHAGQMHAEIEGLDEIKTELGIDPLKDIKDATIYGSGDPEKGEMVLVLTTTGAVEDAVTRLKAQMTLTDVTVGGRTFHVFEQDQEKTYFQIRPGSSSDDRVVVIARNQAQLIKGIDVLDRASPSLETEKTAPLAASAAPKSGSFFFAAARGLPRRGPAHLSP